MRSRVDPRGAATWALVSGCMLCPIDGPAATFCVATPQTLAQALGASAGNGESDEIRLVQGVYAAPMGGFAATVPANESLHIAGGYASTPSGCATRAENAALTTIDGGGVNRGISILAAGGAGDVAIVNLTVRNAMAAQGSAITVDGDAGFAGDVLIERVVIAGNTAVAFAGGVYVESGGGAITVRGCLFRGNAAPTSSALYVANNGGTAFVSNCTIAGNSVSGMGVAVGGNGTNAVVLTNNVMWGNTTLGQFDLVADADIYMFHNDVQALGGAPNAGSSGNLSVVPGFASADDYHLASLSQLIDAGQANAGGGSAMVDLDGAARVSGAQIDIGAYERSELVLADSFE